MYRYAPFRYGGGRASQGGQQHDGATYGRHHDERTSAAASYPRHVDEDEDSETMARNALHELAMKSEEHRLRNSYAAGSSSSSGHKGRNSKEQLVGLESTEDRKPASRSPNKQSSAFPHTLNFAISDDIYKSRARQQMDSALEKLNEAREKVGSTMNRVEELTASIPNLKASVDTYLENATETAQELLDELLEDHSVWNAQYKLLEEWYNEHGTTKLPWKKEWKREHPELSKLGTWLIQQRKEYRATRDGTAGNQAMEPYKILALERLDVAWDPYDADWNSRFQELQRYKEEHGDCQVPMMNEKSSDSSSTKYNSLGVWCKRQRQQYRAFQLGDSARIKNMTQERILKLTELGFQWSEIAEFESDESFAAHVSQLNDFKNKFGHYKVTPKKDAPLAAWLKGVLAKFKRFEKQHEGCGLRVPQYEKIKELNILGQNTIEAVFDIRMAELTEFVKTFGHGNVPFDYGQNIELANFVANQRQQWKKFKSGKKSSMTSEREKQMIEAGFEFEMTKERRRATRLGPTPMTWDDHFSQYALFQKEAAKEFSKSQASKESDKDQREESNQSDQTGSPTSKGKGSSIPGSTIDAGSPTSKGEGTSIPGSTIDAGTGEPRTLPNMGKDDDPSVSKRVSFEDSNPRLSSKKGKAFLWAEEQRVQYALKQWGKESTLTPEQIGKLNSIEFDWKVSSSPSVGWEEMFSRLLEHRLKSGSFDVSNADEDLRDWVSVQVAELPKLESGIPCRITKEQVDKLNKAGFPWGSALSRKDPTAKVLKTWEEYYSELLIQRIKCGSFKFPDELVDLKLWMEVQRRVKVKFENEQLSRSAILEHRIRQLTAIGFPWEPTDRNGRRVPRPKSYRAYAMPIGELVYASTGQGPLVEELVAEASGLGLATKRLSGPPPLIDPKDPYIIGIPTTPGPERGVQQEQLERRLLRFEGGKPVYADSVKLHPGSSVTNVVQHPVEVDQVQEHTVLKPPPPEKCREESVERPQNPPAEEDFDTLLESYESKYRPATSDRKRKATELTDGDEEDSPARDVKRRASAVPTPRATEDFVALLESKEKQLLALARGGGVARI